MLLPAFQMLIAQQSNVKWEKWNSLIGYWEGEGNGQPGKGGGSFSFQTDLNSNILVRKGHTEFPAAKDQPASVHDDLMVIYPDNTGVATRAIYFEIGRAHV